MPGKDGLLHISEIDWKRYETMDGIFKEGDKVTVKLLDVDKQGKMKLSRKAPLPGNSVDLICIVYRYINVIELYFPVLDSFKENCESFPEKMDLI
ncbi:hypothetical protein FQR65_LT19609 [Abscondita terminalis]|nr:hypothetical protein FQR65_LT19609 [Abscondita terminalis]